MKRPLEDAWDRPIRLLILVMAAAFHGILLFGVVFHLRDQPKPRVNEPVVISLVEFAEEPPAPRFLPAPVPATLSPPPPAPPPPDQVLAPVSPPEPVPSPPPDELAATSEPLIDAPLPDDAAPVPPDDAPPPAPSTPGETERNEKSREVIEKDTGLKTTGLLEALAPPTPEYWPQSSVTAIPQFNKRLGTALTNAYERSLSARAGVEGEVILELFIDERGNIRRIEKLKEEPDDRGLFDLVLRVFNEMSARKERVVTAPAKAGDKPVAVRMRYPVRFRLN